MRVLLSVLVLVLGAGVANAHSNGRIYGQPSDFLGVWRNVENRGTQLLQVIVRPDYGRYGKYYIKITGICGGEPCTLCEYHGNLFQADYPPNREQDNAAIMLPVLKDYVRGQVLLRFNRRGEIVTHALLQFRDRRNVYSVDRFVLTGTFPGDYDDYSSNDGGYRR